LKLELKFWGQALSDTMPSDFNQASNPEIKIRPDPEGSSFKA